MNYEEEMKAILAESRQLDLATRRLLWDLTRNLPDTIRRTAEARMDKLKEHEGFRRMGRTEHQRAFHEIESEERASRQLEANGSRFVAESRLLKLEPRHGAHITALRREVGLSFPRALDHLDPHGMLTYHLLMETLRPTIESAPVDVLLTTYHRTQQTRDAARSRIEAELIEERVDRGGLTTGREQLAVAKELREVIAFVQGLRVPNELTVVAETIARAKKAVSRADLARVPGVNIDHPGNEAAKRAFESGQQEFERALAEEKAQLRAGA